MMGDDVSPDFSGGCQRSANSSSSSSARQPASSSSSTQQQRRSSISGTASEKYLQAFLCN